MWNNNIHISILILSLMGFLTAQLPRSKRQEDRFGWIRELEVYPYYGILEISTIPKDGSGTVERIYCGSTIIGIRWLLSAAHCFANHTIEKINVYVGTSRMQRGERYEVDLNVTLHPEFKRVPRFNNRFRSMNNLAVLKTVLDFNFTEHVQPLEIMDENVTAHILLRFVGIDNLTIYDDDKNPATPNFVTSNLRATIRLLMNIRSCYPIFKGLPGYFDKLMCTVIQQEELKDGCFGNPGGPIVMRAEYPADKRLLGIIPEENWCDRFPDTFLNTYAYLDFIHEITGPLAIDGFTSK